MLIDLEASSLKKIVKDGIREIVNEISGRNKNSNKLAWFNAVKAMIKEYQNQFMDAFLPVLLDDFGKDITIKFTGGVMSDESIGNLKMFIDMVERSNVQKLIDDLVKKIENLKIDEKNVELKEKRKAVTKAVVEGHQWIMRRLDLHVKKVVSDAVYRKSVERSKIPVMLYNFVDGQIPEHLKDMFKNGMDSVPDYRMTKREIDHRVEEALVEYLERLGRRRICGTAVKNVSSVKDWFTVMFSWTPNMS